MDMSTDNVAGQKAYMLKQNVIFPFKFVRGK